jgi:heavy metal sensor kinase
MKRWWHRQNVRARLAWSYSGTMALVLATYALGVFVFVNHVLQQDLDSRLRDDFELAEESLQVADAEVTLARPKLGREHDEQQPWVEVWEPPARIRFRTPRAGSAMLDELDQLPVAGYELDSAQSVSGERLRTMTGIVTSNGMKYGIRVARSEEPLRHELQELLFGMTAAFPIAIGLAGFAGARMARRSLRPIERMAERARSITADRLHDRLPIDNPNDELGQLAAVFNETLSRLERSFDQLRRFTADASHELRTPLTAIRSVGEVGLSERHDASAYRDIIGSMLEEAERLTRLVDSLLTLSRADAGEGVLQTDTVDLTELAREVVGELSVLAEEKQQVLRIESDGPVVAASDRVTLTQAIVNLLHNAIKYSQDGAEILIIVSRDPEPRIDIVDRGPGIPREHQDRIFDRFYRVDRSRSRSGGGVGLGLSIARSAVHANRGRLLLHSTGPSGSTFRITLPSTDA